MKSSQEINSSSKTKNGFTLMEVITSITIFAVSIIIIIAIFPKVMRMSRESKEISVATQLAQEKIEEILAQSYDDIPTGTIETRQKVSMDLNSQFYIYEREVTVNYIDGNFQNSINDTGLKKATTTVYWQENGIEKNVQLVRIFNKL